MIVVYYGIDRLLPARFGHLLQLRKSVWGTKTLEDGGKVSPVDYGCGIDFVCVWYLNCCCWSCLGFGCVCG